MAPATGRQARAARNDERILTAARAVFIVDPGAPIAAVADRAGVGISALYRRYASKEDLLRKLCADGLQRYVAEVEAALADDDDPWPAFARFMTRVVEADTNSLVQRLAGTFTSTDEMRRQAARGQQLTEQLVQRTRAAGALRPDIDVVDIALLFEQIAAVRIGDEQRTRQLRLRYLGLVLNALRTPGDEPLPAPPPTWEELGRRWRPRKLPRRT